MSFCLSAKSNSIVMHYHFNSFPPSNQTPYNDGNLNVFAFCVFCITLSLKAIYLKKAFDLNRLRIEKEKEKRKYHSDYPNFHGLLLHHDCRHSHVKTFNFQRLTFHTIDPI